MDYKQVSKGLGLFSIALGAAELLASRRIARALSAEGHERLIKGFGAREVVAGAGLLMAPAHSTRVWNRVAGDVMDLGALGLVARRAPGKKAVLGALAFIVGATALDAFVAMRLDRKTGKVAPIRPGSETGSEAGIRERSGPAKNISSRDDADPSAPPSTGDATSIEPPNVAHPQPPHVAVVPA